MRNSALLVVLLSSLVRATSAGAEPSVLGLLDQAEKIRDSDKTRARQLLDAAERAIASAPDPRLIARAQLLECRWADDPPAAYRAFERGFPEAVRAGDVTLQGKLVFCRARGMWYEGKETDAEREFARAAELARKGGDTETEADAMGSVGSLQYSRGAMADALQNLQRGYAMAERHGHAKLRRDILSVIANVYADANVAQYDRAIEYYGQLLAEYEKSGTENDVADTLFNIGATFETMGDLHQATTHYRKALGLFQRVDSVADIAFTRRSLASALTKQGHAAQALPLLDRALAYYQKERSAAQIAMTRHFRGMAYRRLNRSQEALQDLAAAREYFESEKNIRFLEKNLSEVAAVHAQLGEWRSAYEATIRQSGLQQELAVARRDEVASRLRVEFDVEKKERENRALTRENSLRSAALAAARESQRLQTIVIALTALLALSLALLFWRQVVNTRRMHAMAMTDELTRLPNRRNILAALDTVFTIAKRHGRPVAVIVFDIDRFKRINDTWGHAAGDLVLKTVARTCRLAIRPGDHIGRTGGEEFLVVLHEASFDQAREIAERLRASVEQIDFSAIEPGLRVTISLGVWLAGDYDAMKAVSSADALLYRAKEAGRNRVEIAVSALSS